MGSRRRDRGGARSLHVRGYDVSNTGDRELRSVFEKFGNVVDVYLPKDYFTKQFRGFAYVQFSDEADADEARKKLDHTEIFNDGREVHIMWAAGERKTPVDMRRLDIERDNPHARRERERGGGQPWPRGRSPRRFGPRGGPEDWDLDRYPRKRFRSPSPASRYRRDRSPMRRRRYSRSPRRAPRSRSPGMRRSRSPRDRSRSPGLRRPRRSRSPPLRRRSRSPGMRGPRRLSRSPPPRRSRSPGMRGPRKSSRSPLPRRSRSPAKRGYGRMSPRRPSSRSPPPPRRASSRTPPPLRRSSRSPPRFKRRVHSRSPLRNKEGPVVNGNGLAVSRAPNHAGGNGPTPGGNAPPKLRSAPLSPIETTNASNSTH